MQNANPVSPASRCLWTAVLALALTGCGGGSASAGPEPAGIGAHYTLGVAGHPASVQVAVLGSEQERGLMQRPDLGADEGMIFVNARPQRLSFWMRNTPEPLDVAYIAPDGTIQEIYPLLPLDERPVNSHATDLQYALEMPAGWFAKHGVAAGSKIDLAALSAALKARGFEPENFRLK